MTYYPNNPNGQATMANSAPVVIASNQSSIPVASTLQSNTGVDIGKLTANQSVNVSQVNGVTTLMGNGVTGTGSQRVTIASDNTAFSVNAIESGTWTVQPGNTPNTIPWLFTPNDGTTSSTFLPDNTDAITPSATANKIPVIARNYLFGSASAVWERVRRVENGLNTTGGGVQAAGLVGQFDDVSPTSITENQFGNLRMSANRNAYTTLRDAAGNERGANVTSANALVVDGSASTQPIQGGKTNNNAVPGATNLGVLPGIANAAAQTWTEGDQVLESMDLSGNQRVTLGTALSQAIDSILTYPFGHSYAHISTAATTTVKSGAGVLHNISVNTLGTVASTTTVYDNTAGSGTVIAVINTLALSGSFVLDVAFSTGLTIVTTGTVAPDITISYR